MTICHDLSDAQWRNVEGLLVSFHGQVTRRGRPRRDPRSILNGVLWVLRTGMSWAALPERYPDYRTCHRRFKAWYDTGVLFRVLLGLFGAEGIEMCEMVERRMRNRRKKPSRHPSQ